MLTDQADAMASAGCASVGRSRSFEFGVDKTELHQALVRLLTLGLGGRHQFDDFNQHRNGNLRLVLATEQRRKPQIRFGEQTQSVTPFGVHLPGDPSIEATEGTAEIPVERQQLLRGLAGIVVLLSGSSKITGCNKRIASAIIARTADVLKPVCSWASTRSEDGAFCANAAALERPNEASNAVAVSRERQPMEIPRKFAGL